MRALTVEFFVSVLADPVAEARAVELDHAGLHAVGVLVEAR
jgi:hypothetical protein